jgi:L-threonylcarbamoyladenylate synthase
VCPPPVAFSGDDGASGEEHGAVIRAATPRAIAEAAARLRAGDLVAFPTETVYGLGANALDADAVARIFAAKGRPAWNPVIVHVASSDAARALVAEWPARAQRLADACWPGPLTLVLRRAPHVPDIVTAGSETVGVRVPAHPVALALLEAAGVPIAAPSANRFTQLSPTTAAHVHTALGDRVACILDGGPTDVGIESTVLDLTGDVPRVLRSGLLEATAIAALLGEPVALGAPAATAPDAPRPSPGLVERHYAPRAELWLVPEQARGEAEAALDRRLDAARATGRHELVGAITIGDGWHPAAAQQPRHLPDAPADYARALYATLHALDDAGCTLIVVAEPPAEGAWRGIHDRLTRATR